MNAKILDCEVLADKYFSQVKKELQEIRKTPKVKMLLSGDDEGSKSYSKIMIRTFKGIGIESILINVDSPGELEDKIMSTETENNITGVFVFYPINFQGIEDRHFMKMIPQFKDVEGLGAENIYRLIHYRKVFENTPCKAVVPCTPKAVIKVLTENDISIKSKDVLIANKSYILGAPLRRMFDNLGATVTACDINTKPDSIKYYAKNADIVVTAVPQKIELFDDKDIKEGAAIIDCSFDGNFDAEKISKKAGSISYRQGRNYIGRVTTAISAVNVLYLLKHQIYLEERKKKNG